MVYIAGPLSTGGLADNLTRANAMFRRLHELDFVPIVPHWSAYSGEVHVCPTSGQPYAFATVEGMGLSHREWLAIDVEIVSRCDAVYRLPGESKGADLEVIHALSRGLPVFYDVADLVRWRRELETVVVS